MGNMEERSRKRAKRGELKSAILQVVAAAGLISLAIAMPNAPKVIPRSLLKKIFDRSRNTRDVTISKLVKAGFLRREIVRGARVLRITSEGIRHLTQERMRHIHDEPKRWDGKWRVVIFDIKEPRRNVRDGLRYELSALGFEKLQNSVWAYPYPCEEFVALLKADLKVGKDILYMIVDEIENDRHLREHFNLPLSS